MLVSRSATARRRSRGCSARPDRSRRAATCSASSDGDGRYAVDAGRYAYAPRSDTMPPTNGTTFLNHTPCRARTCGESGSATSSSARRPPGRTTRAHSAKNGSSAAKFREREAGHDPCDRRVREREPQRVAAHERGRNARRSRACRRRSRHRRVSDPASSARGRGRRCRRRDRGPPSPARAAARVRRCGANRRPSGTSACG